MSQITPAQISAARTMILNRLIETPVLALRSDRWRGILPTGADCDLKLELFQQSGSFKGRGAILGIAGLTDEQKQSGVVAASGGNHAMAVSWAAQAEGLSAKIAIPKAADPLRINACADMGAEIVLCDDIAEAFQVMEQSVHAEGRTMLHPFEGAHMTLGAATCGAEFIDACPDADVFVVPVGGGGLISGMAAAIKLAKPEAWVVGVEPYGADTLYQSLQKGEPVRIAKVTTIADSLGSPTAMPLSFALAQEYVDEVVRVEDSELLAAMGHYYDVLRIIAEPACAASLAGLIGPLKDRVKGKKVGLIACGSNISMQRYQSLMAQ